MDKRIVLPVGKDATKRIGKPATRETMVIQSFGHLITVHKDDFEESFYKDLRSGLNNSSKNRN